MYAWSCPAVCPSDIKPDNKPIRDELRTSPTSNQTWPWHYKYLTPAHTNRVIKNAHIDLATCIRQKQITLIQTPAIIISQTIAATLSVTRTIKGNVGVFLLLQNDNLYQWTHQRSNFPFHPNSSLPTEEVALSLIGCLPAWQTWKHLKLRNGNWTCPLPGRYSAYIYFQMHETEKKRCVAWSVTGCRKNSPTSCTNDTAMRPLLWRSHQDCIHLRGIVEILLSSLLEYQSVQACFYSKERYIGWSQVSSSGRSLISSPLAECRQDRCLSGKTVLQKASPCITWHPYVVLSSF